MHANEKPRIFEARELSPYQTYVAESELREGEVYFTVSYLDDHMLVPALTPMTFIGKHLQGDDSEGMLYFQDYDSYRQGVRWPELPPDAEGLHATIIAIRSGESTDMCDYERALESLLKCSLRRLDC